MICVDLSLQGLNRAPTQELSVAELCKLKRGQKAIRSDVNQGPGHQAQAVQDLRQLSSASESGSELVSNPLSIAQMVAEELRDHKIMRDYSIQDLDYESNSLDLV